MVVNAPRVRQQVVAAAVAASGTVAGSSPGSARTGRAMFSRNRADIRIIRSDTLDSFFSDWTDILTLTRTEAIGTFATNRAVATPRLPASPST